MKLQVDSNHYIDTDQPIDISIPLQQGPLNVNAWYCNPVSIEPVRTEHFTGSVKEGGTVNFRNISLNPHGNGTHTECLGHITEEVYSINDTLQTFWFEAFLISISPEKIHHEKYNDEDQVITLQQVQEAFKDYQNESAVVIRTLPNEKEKLTHQYSNDNPPYIAAEAMQWIVDHTQVKHLLIDLPSVDREIDEGVLACHHIFWNVPQNPDYEKTITELVYVPNEIEDGRYFLNLQITSIVNDASPSKPVLYKIHVL